MRMQRIGTLIALVLALGMGVGCSSMRARLARMRGGDEVAEAPPEASAPAQAQADIVEEPALVTGASIESVFSSTASAYVLRPQDRIIVNLRGIPKEETHEDVIDDEGFINLPFINEIKASGRKASDLERAIRAAYIDGQFFRNINVSVVLPSQSYYVRGEVRQPGRYPMMSGVTVVQAIAAAGGYTDFARRSKVQLVRQGFSTYVDAGDMEDNPEQDLPIEAGDVIVVHRSVF